MQGDVPRRRTLECQITSSSFIPKLAFVPANPADLHAFLQEQALARDGEPRDEEEDVPEGARVRYATGARYAEHTVFTGDDEARHGAVFETITDT